MNVLVACEESQRVCTAFRNRGFTAFSCDILDQSGGHPEWHIKCDVSTILNPSDKPTGRKEIWFITQDGINHSVLKWDLIIAHPPCTYLTCTGNKWFKDEFKDRFPDRIKQREEAIAFFMLFANADCEHIAIENPVGVMSTRWRKPDQYIQPFWFGEPERKKTGLWLKNLPLLTPTNMVEPAIVHCASGATECRWHIDTMGLEANERSRIRSQTFIGVAKAFSEQWGNFIRSV